jgi:acetylornithine deacetylase/succinyl-diaminopimelate desuccinylase-like protein
MLPVAASLDALARELRERGSMLVVGGAAESGANFNVVPGSAWFSADLRFDPSGDLDDELDLLLTTIDEAATAAGADVRVQVLQRQPAAATDERHPAARALAGAIEAVEGASARFELCPGVLDTRWYAQLGVPAFAYGAGLLEVSHGPEEYVDEAALRRCAAVYALAAGSLLQGEPS